MTDLVHLKSRIAAFAGHESIPDAMSAIPDKAKGIEAFLATLTPHTFDALHIVEKVIVTSYGDANDLNALVLHFIESENDKATAFFCTAHDASEHILFCGSQMTETVLLRTQNISMKHILQLWHASI